MKVEDLRIGNLVYHGGKTVKVVGIDKKHVSILKDPLQCYFHTVPINGLEPIPLTEEILLKCGFYYDTDYLTFCIPTCTIRLDDYGSEGYMCIIFGEDLYLINNLHQLQNLYHSLTNKELNYETN